MTLTPQLADDLNVRGLSLGHTLLQGSSQWYQEGYFHVTGDGTGWYLNLGPAALAATMAKYATDGKNNTYAQLAIDTVERGFKYNIYGSLAANTQRFAAGYEGVLDPSQDDTCNIEAIASIGMCMMMLWDRLAPADRQRWLNILKGCGEWLSLPQPNGPGYPYYYINGNYAIHLCLAYYTLSYLCRLMGDETGYTRFNLLYEGAYSAMTDPHGFIDAAMGTGNHWLGYGLIVDTTGVRNDWSDFTAHLTETNGYVGSSPSPNFDGAYSLFQLDLLSRLYLLKRDHRINRLLNAIHNKIAPLMTISSVVTIDCTGGSRQTGVRGYTGSWLQVIRLIGLRETNTTIFTDTNMRLAWDSEVLGNMQQGLSNAATAIGTQRQWYLAVANTIDLAQRAVIKVA